MTRNQTVDTLLQLGDGVAALTASAYSVVAAATAQIDVGDHAIAGNVAIDISALGIANDDEIYTFTVLGSASATYASGIVPLAMMQFGAGAVMLGVADLDTVAGRYVIPFRNEKDGTVYRYIRLYVTIAGTTKTITYIAYVHKGLLQSAP
jgi:hypothetical protein